MIYSQVSAFAISTHLRIENMFHIEPLRLPTNKMNKKVLENATILILSTAVLNIIGG